MEARLILFDIDQTLVFMGGAGLRCLERAFVEVCGSAMAGVIPDGKTDPVILREALAHAGIPPERWSPLEQDCLDRYAAYLEEDLANPNPDRQVKPGVVALLEALARSAWAHLGLLTGNLETTGRLKLRALGLDHYFPVGGFASDCSNRCNLGPVALERARRHFGIAFEPSQVWVVGDTAHDVQAARALGARALAVATGRYPVEVLRETRAEAILGDLSDLPRVLEILQN